MLSKKDVEMFFGTTPTPTQLQIINSILDDTTRRVIISSYTQYGKSYSVAIAVCFYILTHKDAYILLVSPSYRQTDILRSYIAKFIINSVLSDLVDLSSGGVERLRREVSRSKITFKNGCELHMLSAEGTAERLMGFGAGKDGIVIMDESCLIDYEVYKIRISRMLTGGAKLVEIGNPFNKFNQMYEHWIDPNFYKIHIPYEIGIQEKRVSQEFIEEQKQLLSPYEFKILYDAEFPDDTEDTLFKYTDIQKALREIQEPKEKPEKILGIDVSRMGSDLSVFTYVYRYGSLFIVKDIKAFGKQTLTQTAGLILSFLRDCEVNILKIDATGLGSGLFDMINDHIRNEKMDTEVIDIVFSEKADDVHHLNRKSDIYMNLAKLFSEQSIIIPRENTLINQLSRIKYKLTANGKIAIDDNQDKSPDYSDSLAIACYVGNKQKIIVDTNFLKL